MSEGTRIISQAEQEQRLRQLERRVADLEAQVRMLAAARWSQPAPAPAPYWPNQPWTGLPPNNIVAHGEMKNPTSGIAAGGLGQRSTEWWSRPAAPHAAAPIQPGETAWLNGSPIGALG